MLFFSRSSITPQNSLNNSKDSAFTGLRPSETMATPVLSLTSTWTDGPALVDWHREPLARIHRDASGVQFFIKREKFIFIWSLWWGLIRSKEYTKTIIYACGEKIWERKNYRLRKKSVWSFLFFIYMWWGWSRCTCGPHDVGGNWNYFVYYEDANLNFYDFHDKKNYF